MKLTTKSEYSLLALIYIARNGKDRFVKIEDICDQYAISKKYLEQLFVVLKQTRLVRTKRGAQGGYALARPADTITLAEIFRLMDGALAPSESVSTYYFSHTPIEKEGKVVDLLQTIRDFISQKLENVTLADMV